MRYRRENKALMKEMGEDKASARLRESKMPAPEAAGNEADAVVEPIPVGVAQAPQHLDEPMDDEGDVVVEATRIAI